MKELTNNDPPGKNDRKVCPHSLQCSGCHYWSIPFEAQRNLKVLDLQSWLKLQNLNTKVEIQYVEVDSQGLRDRLDFTLENGQLGLYSKDKPQQIQDLPVCLQLSPGLQDWLSEFREIKWPLQKASFRLRISPKGVKGLWIDCANVDIKKLLDEKTILEALQKICFVEMGQRRKVPRLVDGTFKLFEPEQNAWFETWLDDNSPLPLYCQVASFTQPSHRANKVLSKLIRDWVAKSKGGSGALIEFGSGIGNLTFPAAVHASSVTACEVDKLALEGLARTLNELPPSWQHLRNKIEIHAGDFQRRLESDFSKFQTVLANPPRSGLMKFLDPLESLDESKRPSQFIYMSCFPESLCVDLKRLQGMGYEIQELIILDQFPQSTHYEILCYLQK